MRLTDLVIGESARIVKVKATGEIGSRLLNMGLVKGTTCTLIRKAPLGDPLEIKIKGFYLSLRIKEAETVEVIRL